ncbi:hypothetical protein EVAR_100139_1 [Eumeta japonica]|uniref:Uncharacterized protein n=1 Tax=Eumeta variegata TaxID=151549 RepID=A0A4C1SC38_EUMVA|nr:hypothetical protein EVAR_100139_1 [Eumeta japonica]
MTTRCAEENKSLKKQTNILSSSVPAKVRTLARSLATKSRREMSRGDDYVKMCYVCGTGRCCLIGKGDIGSLRVPASVGGAACAGRPISKYFDIVTDF